MSHRMGGGWLHGGGNGCSPDMLVGMDGAAGRMRAANATSAAAIERLGGVNRKILSNNQLRIVLCGSLLALPCCAATKKRVGKKIFAVLPSRRVVASRQSRTSYESGLARNFRPPHKVA
jgi:hypothetical protein